ncbi:MAG: cobalamin biosynthesis protein [Candidatus Calescibacterium sp.]|nr:cobalamin biosynthesis protein [Candidatus Calescibacterium sp.]MCX7734354.1 cobalamin biosynthesis protein [bacterium]MDW8086882.1 cobalamin biosynthesis protein [Candidatus Calescibacterium sp.]
MEFENLISFLNSHKDSREIIVLVIALVFDIFFGEPPSVVHPVVITGKAIQCSEKIGEKLSSSFLKILFGFALIIFGSSVFFGLYFVGRKIVSLADIYIFELIFDAFFLKTTFALRSLVEHSGSVMRELKKGDIQKARLEVAKIVGRKTEKLQRPHIISASVESVAENTVDSFFSPILFFLLFGIYGSIFYRVINTLDAMVGYKNEKYKYIGLIPAKTDDLLNFIPARISIIFIFLGILFMRLDAKSSISTLLKFKRATPSPNSYVPICMFSGALNVRLEKIGFYSIGDFALPQSEEIIRKSNILAVVSCLIFYLFVIFVEKVM